MDELLDIAAVAPRRPAGRQRRRAAAEQSDGPALPEPEMVDVPQVPVEALDLMAIAAVRAEPDGGGVVDRRGHEHMRVMLHAREVKRLKTTISDKDDQLAVLQRALTVAGLQYPSLRSVDVIKNASGGGVRTDLAKSKLLESLAMSKRPRGRTEMAAQTRAVHIISATVLTLQGLMVARTCSAGDVEEIFVKKPSVALTWQWDETKQKLKVIWKGLHTDKTRAPGTQVGMDIQVASGHLCKFLREDSAPSSKHPLFAKSLVLFGKTAGFLMESFVRQCPWKITDAEYMRDLATECELVFLLLGCDRVSANLVKVRKLFDVIWNGAPRNVIPMVEPCGLHGNNLAQERSDGLTSLRTALSGWSRLAKDGKTLNSLRELTYINCASVCRVVDGPPPAAVLNARKASWADSHIGVVAVVD